jgi:hypothetical protein
MPFLQRPLPIYTTYFALSHFRFNALWLAAFCYANPLFVMGMSFSIYAFTFTSAFFRNANGV